MVFNFIIKNKIKGKEMEIVKEKQIKKKKSKTLLTSFLIALMLIVGLSFLLPSKITLTEKELKDFGIEEKLSSIPINNKYINGKIEDVKFNLNNALFLNFSTDLKSNDVENIGSNSKTITKLKSLINEDVKNKIKEKIVNININADVSLRATPYLSDGKVYIKNLELLDFVNKNKELSLNDEKEDKTVINDLDKIFNLNHDQKLELISKYKLLDVFAKIPVYDLEKSNIKYLSFAKYFITKMEIVNNELQIHFSLFATIEELLKTIFIFLVFLMALYFILPIMLPFLFTVSIVEL